MPEKRAQFDKWYEEHKNDFFDFKATLKEYGINDVILLAHGIAKYRTLIREITDLKFEDCFYSCSTLAATTLRILRLKHLKPQTVAIIPYGNYGANENQSKIALDFLKYLAHERNLNLQHKDNKGEKT